MEITGFQGFQIWCCLWGDFEKEGSILSDQKCVILGGFLEIRGFRFQGAESPVGEMC